MEQNISLRGGIIILLSVFGGGFLLTGLTVSCWHFFMADGANLIGPGVPMFTFPQGMVLGLITGCALEMWLSGRIAKASRLCLTWGTCILVLLGGMMLFRLINDPPGPKPQLRLALAWDAFTLLWGIGLFVWGIALRRRSLKTES